MNSNTAAAPAYTYNIHSRLVALPRKQRKALIAAVRTEHLISQPTWFRYINELTEFPAPVLKTIADKLGVKMEALFNQQ